MRNESIIKVHILFKILFLISGFVLLLINEHTLSIISLLLYIICHLSIIDIRLEEN